MNYVGVRDRKKEKRRQNKFHYHVFLLHNILQPSVSVYKIFIGAEKSMTKTFIGEKEKRTNKGNDKA